MIKRGQAALEFLTTYGWAFLVILIMVGALAYFGILKPSKLLPDRCSFGPEVDCIDFQISKTSESIKIRLKNNVGEAVTINSVTATTESATALMCPTAPATAAYIPIGVWAAGDIKDFTFSSCNSDAVGFIISEKSKVNIKISYYSVRSGSGYGHDLNGELFATVV